jgi:hypothetical protein
LQRDTTFNQLKLQGSLFRDRPMVQQVKNFPSPTIDNILT